MHHGPTAERDFRRHLPVIRSVHRHPRRPSYALPLRSEGDLWRGILDVRLHLEHLLQRAVDAAEPSCICQG